MAERRDDEPVYVEGLCIICQRPPETCPSNTHGCLIVGLIAELRRRTAERDEAHSTVRKLQARIGSRSG